MAGARAHKGWLNGGQGQGAALLTPCPPAHATQPGGRRCLQASILYQQDLASACRCLCNSWNALGTAKHAEACVLHQRGSARTRKSWVLCIDAACPCRPRCPERCSCHIPPQGTAGQRRMPVSSTLVGARMLIKHHAPCSCMHPSTLTCRSDFTSLHTWHARKDLLRYAKSAGSLLGSLCAGTSAKCG